MTITEKKGLLKSKEKVEGKSRIFQMIFKIQFGEKACDFLE